MVCATAVDCFLRASGRRSLGWRNSDRKVGNVNIGHLDFFGHRSIALKKSPLIIVQFADGQWDDFKVARILHQDRVAVRGNSMKSESAIGCKRSGKREKRLPVWKKTDQAVVDPVSI